MIKPELRTRLEQLALKCAEMTQYDEFQSIGWVPKTADISGRKWGTLVEAYSLMDGSKINTILLARILGVRDNKESALAHAEQQIQTVTGFDRFSFVAEGNSGLVFLGQSETDVSVLRFTLSPDSEIGSAKNNRNEVNRSECPFLLQGRMKPIIVSGVHVEVLPLVQLFQMSQEDMRELNGFLNILTRETCYQPQCHELGLLPDGSLVVVDPGECGYSAYFWNLDIADREREIARSNALIAMRIESWGLPEQLKWFDSGQVLKQHAFFPPIMPPDNLGLEASVGFGPEPHNSF